LIWPPFRGLRLLAEVIRASKIGGFLTYELSVSRDMRYDTPALGTLKGTEVSTTLPKLLTLGEVAELIRKPHGTLRYWRHVGKGPQSFKLGRSIMYDERDVLAWLEAVRADARAAS